MANRKIFKFLSLALLITIVLAQDELSTHSTETDQPTESTDAASETTITEIPAAPGGDSNDKAPNFPLPDGSNIGNISKEQFQSAPNDNDTLRKIFFNNDKIVAYHVAQSKVREQAPNPYTIGEILAYLYELAEWGEEGPPAGFTLELKGQKIPKKYKEKRSPRVKRVKRSRLVFRNKYNSVV